MMRLMLSFLSLLALTALAGLVANLPGTVELSVDGWLVETRFAVLAGVFVVAVLALVALIGLAQLLLNLPARMRAARQATRRLEGETALANALMALARGDAGAAALATGLAREKLPHQALPRLMSAQAALLDARVDDASADYHAMLQPDTSLQQKVLGLEGLYYMARAAQDTQAAGSHALHVLEMAPRTLWALDGMMTLAVQIGDWSSAHDWLRRWSRAGVKRADVKRRRAVLLMAEAQALLASDEPADRLKAKKKAEQAVALDKRFIAAIGLLAELHAASGGLPKARKILRQAFSHQPHAALAEAWLGCHGDQPLTSKQRAVTSFIGPHKDHSEAHILRARIALDGERWRLARTLLLPHAEAPTATRRLCTMMAEAQAGLNEPAEAQYWQDRARRAPSSAGWMSGGMRLDGWKAICPVTGRLDQVAWQSPRHAQAALLAGQAALSPDTPDAPVQLTG